MHCRECEKFCFNYFKEIWRSFQVNNIKLLIGMKIQIVPNLSFRNGIYKLFTLQKTISPMENRAPWCASIEQ